MEYLVTFNMILVRPLQLSNVILHFSIIFDSIHLICNKLGKGRPRLETGATDDGLSGFSKNRHNPVMVYNYLMIRNITVHNYNKDRSQPVTIQCLYT